MASSSVTEIKNINFRYFRDRHSKVNNGSVSVGYRVMQNKNSTTIEYAIALCSPKDVFNRKHARIVIYKRFKEGNFAKIKVHPFVPTMAVDIIKTHYNSHVTPAHMFGLRPLPGPEQKSELPKFAKYIQTCFQ